jgi:hypothetical protein
MIYVVILVAVVFVVLLMLTWTGTSAYRKEQRDRDESSTAILASHDGHTHSADCGHDTGCDSSSGSGDGGVH